jgi:hypothetical protein
MLIRKTSKREFAPTPPARPELIFYLTRAFFVVAPPKMLFPAESNAAHLLFRIDAQGRGEPEGRGNTGKGGKRPEPSANTHSRVTRCGVSAEARSHTFGEARSRGLARKA